MDQISIFLHEPGKNIFFIEQDTMPDNFKIDRLKLRRVLTNQLEKLEAAKAARLVCLSLQSLTGSFLVLLGYFFLILPGLT